MPVRKKTPQNAPAAKKKASRSRATRGRSFTPSPESELPIEIVEGARYWSVDDAELLVKQIAGDIVHYTIDDGENVFTEKRGRFREIVERRIGDDVAAAAPGPREVKATVDGKDAQIVIDGTTGKVLQPGEQATLIQTPIEDLVHQLVKHDALIAELASQRGSISNQLKNAKERREEIIAEIKHRDPSAPSLFTPSPSDADDFDDFGRRGVKWARLSGITSCGIRRAWKKRSAITRMRMRTADAEQALVLKAARSRSGEGVLRDMTAMQKLRTEREAQALQILARGGKYSRMDLIREFFSVRRDQMSEFALHKMMLDLEERGLAVAEKQKIRGAFSRFRFVYKAAA